MSFDFLGFTFRPRLATNKRGMYYTGFLGAISQTAAKSIREKMKSWALSRKVSITLQDIASLINPTVRGWINYYNLFRKRELVNTLRNLNLLILRWIRKKYRISSHQKIMKAFKLYREREPKLFVHWAFKV